MLFESQIHEFKAWLPWCRVRNEQRALRAIVEQQRRIMTPEQVAEQSGLIITQLEQMAAFREAQTESGHTENGIVELLNVGERVTRQM